MGVLRDVAAGLKLWKHDEWQLFETRLRAVVESGKAKQIPAFRVVWGPSEEFYLDNETAEVFVYVRPGEPPSYPIWEKVDAFLKPNPTPARPDTLDEIPLGARRNTNAMGLSRLLERMIKGGRAEQISVALKPTLQDKESYYRDLHTGSVFKLSYSDDGEQCWSKIQTDSIPSLFKKQNRAQ